MPMLEERRQSFLNDKDLPRLILVSAIPAITSGVVDMLYNTIDAMFIGHFVDNDALAAISVNIAIQAAFFAVGLLFIIGTNSNISRAMGANDITRARTALVHGFYFCILTTGLVAGAILMNIDWVLIQVGALPDIMQFSKDYATTILWFVPINCGGLVLVGSIRAKGFTDLAMKVSLSGAIFNIILDALFIVGFGWGIKGAALATGMAQLLVFTFALRSVLKLYNFPLRFSKEITFQGKLLKDIIQLGLPTGFRIAIFSLTYIIGNRYLREFGPETLAAYSITMRTAQFIMVFTVGMAAGMQPLIGYNYGAKKFDRVKKIIHTSILLNLCFAVPLGIIFFWAPAQIFQLFTPSVETIKIGQEAIRFIGTATCAYSIVFLTVDSLQAMGFHRLSLFVSTATPILICVGMITFAPIFGRVGVWMSYSVAYTSLMLVALVILYRESAKLDQKHLQTLSVE